ncbi:hypothetical protein C1H46_025414 [Malus baccata]|uniref:Uncharacterized protein n=1 Tax=Malus baccata TaxID=106549 RepID=A0A540LRA2_MALBA|nr:hypothetical protein C1H46_025414 [Malus baccata]
MLLTTFLFIYKKATQLSDPIFTRASAKTGALSNFHLFHAQTLAAPPTTQNLDKTQFPFCKSSLNCKCFHWNRLTKSPSLCLIPFLNGV